MRVIKQVFLFSLLYAALNLALLTFFPTFQRVLAQTAGSPTGQIKPPQKPASAAGSVLTPAPSNPATQEFVDIARLVLEVNRDNTTHLALYIERATILVVLFFSVLGGAGTVFGLRKLADFQGRANAAADEVEKGLNEGWRRMQAFEAEQRELLQKLVTNLNDEMKDHAELMTARMDIGRALADPMVKGQPAAIRLLRDAAQRILVVVKNERVSARDRVRGYAEAAFAHKRIGEAGVAYELVQQAIALQGDDKQSLAVLQFNAACYSALAGKHAEAVTHLAIAIQHEPTYKAKALADDDLKVLHPMQTFQVLIT